MATVDYLLHESSVGYAIFKVAAQPDTIGNRLKEVQAKQDDIAHFRKLVDLVSFSPYEGAEAALSNINDVSEGICSDYLRATLESALPQSGKKQKVTLGVADKNLAGSIKAVFKNLECETSETSEVVADLLRGLRLHGPKLLKQLQEGDMHRAMLGLGHAYSRSKVKFNVNRQDQNIIQAIATLDQLDKAVNQFCMRVREWYGWHFPELIKIVSDNQKYASVVLYVQDKSTLDDSKLHDLATLVDDDRSVAQSIIDAARVSMGREISPEDLESVISFARRAVSLSSYRKSLHSYLVSKMGVVAPNLAALIGEMVGARLISKAGSLTNLAKYPASTVQILGAEKALFRALKTKGNTPKYGLIYHSTFIGRAGAGNKGRISRFLANKCSVASRIDNFSESPTTRFGEALRQQVEERIDFYATGKEPTKNEVAMNRAMDLVLGDINVDDPTNAGAEDEEMADGVTAGATEQMHRKKKGEQLSGPTADALAGVSADKKEKKDKKKKKKHAEEVSTAPEKEEKKKRKHEEVNGEVQEKKKKKKSKSKD